MKNWNPKCKCGEIDKSKFHKNQYRCISCFKASSRTAFTEDERVWRNSYAQGRRDSNPGAYKEYYKANLLQDVYSVYTLKTKLCNLVYVGCTNYKLTHRYNVHKAAVKRSLKINEPSSMAKRLKANDLDISDMYIELVKDFYDKAEALAYERFLTKEMKSLNRSLNGDKGVYDRNR